MNQRESLREICYFRRGCVLSTACCALGVTGSVEIWAEIRGRFLLNEQLGLTLIICYYLIDLSSAERLHGLSFPQKTPKH